MYSLTVAQMKHAEANTFALGIDAHRLMENAGAAVARVFVLLWDGLPVTREATEMLTTLRWRRKTAHKGRL